MLRRALLLGSGALLAGCGPKPRPAPPSAPAVAGAADWIPPDLDVVLRMDLAKVKSALGGVALSALSREVLSRGGGGDAADELVIASLLTADRVYLGYRPDPLLRPLDRVLALEGSFEPLLQAPGGFSGAVDLGADVRYWERTSVELPRGGIARVYAAGNRLRAFVSEAELDAVERVLSGQGGERRLTPPEEGTLSLAARPELLARLAGRGSLRELIREGKALRAAVDLRADGVELTLQLELAGAEQAERLAEAGQEVLSRAGGRVGSATLRAAGDRVVLSAKLERALLAPALGCLLGGSDPTCAW